MFPVLKSWAAEEVTETSAVLRRQWKEFVPAAAEVQAAALRDVVTSTLSELVHEFNIAFDKVKSDEEEREMMSRAYAMFSKWFSQLFVPTATGDASEYVLMRRHLKDADKESEAFPLAVSPFSNPAVKAGYTEPAINPPLEPDKIKEKSGGSVYTVACGKFMSHPRVDEKDVQGFRGPHMVEYSGQDEASKDGEAFVTGFMRHIHNAPVDYFKNRKLLAATDTMLGFFDPENRSGRSSDALQRRHFVGPAGPVAGSAAMSQSRSIEKWHDEARMKQYSESIRASRKRGAQDEGDDSEFEQIPHRRRVIRETSVHSNESRQMELEEVISRVARLLTTNRRPVKFIDVTITGEAGGGPPDPDEPPGFPDLLRRRRYRAAPQTAGRMRWRFQKEEGKASSFLVISNAPHDFPVDVLYNDEVILTAKRDVTINTEKKEPGGSAKVNSGNIIGDGSKTYTVHIFEPPNVKMAECAEYLLLDGLADVPDASDFIRRLTTGYPTSLPADASVFHFATRVRREVGSLLLQREHRVKTDRNASSPWYAESYELVMAKPEEEVYDMDMCLTFAEDGPLWRLGAIPSLTIEAALLACRTAAHF